MKALKVTIKLSILLYMDEKSNGSMGCAEVLAPRFDTVAAA